MIKINSELPLCLFNKNNELNEYDFVLYHLYKENDYYKEYYIKQRQDHPDRLMILDNSAYEFFIKGEELDIMSYIDVINELKPDMYILPDVLMDFNATLNKTRYFVENHIHNITGDSKPMAVLQGNTENELLACALLYKDLDIENIAVPFHNSFFKDMVPEWYEYINITSKYNPGGDWVALKCLQSLNIDIRYAAGRVHWVSKYEDILNSFSHVHILGSHCPAEKIYYKTIKSIKTMDTGYPVKCAYVGDVLFQEKSKPEVIIDDFFESDLNNDIKTLIETNVKTFKLL